MIDPVKLPQLAEARAAENFEFRQFLKHHPRLRSEQVDGLVFRISEQVWKGIDCTTCGNCCREVSHVECLGLVSRFHKKNHLASCSSSRRRATDKSVSNSYSQR